MINAFEVFSNAAELLKSGCLDKAESLCLQVLEQVPEKPDPLNLLGIIKAKQGYPVAACDYFQKALNYVPDRFDIQSNLARALLECGHQDTAITNCHAALKNNPLHYESHYLLGTILQAKEDYHAAISSFERAFQIKSDDVAPLQDIARICEEIGDNLQASRILGKACNHQPQNVDVLIQWGQALYRQGNITESCAVFSRALQLKPDSSGIKRKVLEISPFWDEPLEGLNLLLRRHAGTDVEYLHQCFNDRIFLNQYNRFIRPHQTHAAIAKQVESAGSRHPSQNQRIDWIIIHKKTGKPIGLAALADILFHHQRAEFLIGMPACAQRHNGAAVEASLLVLDFAFTKACLNKLTTGVYSTNPHAQKNALALGFTQESLLREHIFIVEENTFLDLNGNGMTRKDYLANQRLKRLFQRLVKSDDSG